MSVDVGMAQMVETLKKIREEQGEEAFQNAAKAVARQVILKPNGAQYIQKVLEPLIPDLNLDDLRTQAEAKQQAAPQGDPQQALIQALGSQIPNLKTQAQFNVFIAAFDAFRLCMDAAFSGDKAALAKGKETLERSFDAAEQSRDIAEKLKDVPEAAESDEAKEHKDPPKQFKEYDVQKQLMLELTVIQTPDELSEWYEKKKSEMDQVVSATLRNELFDAIRNKKHALQAN